MAIRAEQLGGRSSLAAEASSRVDRTVELSGIPGPVALPGYSAGRALASNLMASLDARSADPTVVHSLSSPARDDNVTIAAESTYSVDGKLIVPAWLVYVRLSLGVLLERNRH